MKNVIKPELNKLYEELRNNAAQDPEYAGRVIITGGGDVNAGIMLVGEAPGGDEERLGAPFVGKAGENLNSFLETVNISRDDLYITNVVKIRPFAISKKSGNPINRPPNRGEIAFFAPYLHEEIALVSPRIVATLGNVALRAVTKNPRARIGDMHGKAFKSENFLLFPLYHPASIIYNRPLAATYNKDIQLLSALLNHSNFKL